MIIYVAVCMTAYAMLNTVGHDIPAYSTHASQYGWTITSAYLHGWVPVALVGVFVWSSVWWVSMNTRAESMQQEQQEQQQRRDIRGKSVDVETTEKVERSWMVVWKLVAVQIVNAVVTLVVNVVFVYVIISGLSGVNQFLVQLK